MLATVKSCLSVREDEKLSPICRSCRRLDISVIYVAYVPQLADFCNHNVVGNRIVTCPTYEREAGSDDEF